MKFLYIKDNNSSFKEYNLNKLYLIAVFLGFIGLISYIGFNVGYYVSSSSNKHKILSVNQDYQEKESKYLQKLSDLDYIEKRLEEIIKKDNLLRTMIGLPQIDSDVYKMGTGGISNPENKIINELEIDIGSKINHFKKITNLETISYTDIYDYVDENLNQILRIPAIHPVSMDKCKMSSGHGERMHPILKRMHMHDGHDFAPIENFWNTEVYATADGRVKKSIYLPDTYGHYIEVDHGNGIVTVYAHLRVRNVRKGQNVKRGQKIGIMGSTGMSTSVHLHYEVKKNGRSIDPTHYYFDQTSL